MADRDALMRDAERKLNAELRERTKPSVDGTPALQAKLHAEHQSLDVALNKMLPLLRVLVGQNDYVRSWRVVRSPEDHENATGLNVLDQPDEVLNFLRTSRNKTDRTYKFSILGFSQLIYPHDPRSYSAQIGYTGGTATRVYDTLDFEARPPSGGDTLTFGQWCDMIDKIVQWRPARYVSVGPSLHGIHNAVFEQRAWPGWMAWFPETIDPSSLPHFAIVRSIGSGTLVAAQDRTIRADRADDLERSADVEMALVQLGVLPLNKELA